MKSSKKITAVDIIRRKSSGKTADKLVMVTAYDATMTMLLESPLVDGDADHLDMLLVGDSLGMLVQGHDNTLPVTLEQMIYHTQCVARAATYAQVIADMPFMSYQVSVEQALLSAGRLVQEGRAHAVKLEGGAVYADRVNAIVNAGIPVVGHIGLTPQSVHRLGGFKVQGKDADGAKQLLNDALALQEAGCYAVVLEAIPQDLAGTITQALDIPTIGIGAGKHCDGQVLVCYDLLGMTPSFGAKFVKRYADMSVQIATAVHRFSAEVREGTFPTDAHSFSSTGQKIAESAPDTLTIAVKEAASVPREISIYGSGTVVRK